MIITLQNFLTEFFHPARGVILIQVVVMASPMPIEQMRAAISSLQLLPGTKALITLLDGSALRERDLARCAPATAEAIFVMADKRAGSEGREDAKAILKALGISNFCQAHASRAAAAALRERALAAKLNGAVPRRLNSWRRFEVQAAMAAAADAEAAAAEAQTPPKLYLQLLASEDKPLTHVVDSIGVAQIVRPLATRS